MASRRTLTLLGILVALAGLSVAAGQVVHSQPELTVANEDDTTYRVTAYTAEDARTALLVNFEVTREDGTRRLATLSQLIWPGEFRNLTLVDADVPTERIVVEPGEEVTTTIESWRPGQVTVYVAEDLGEDEAHVYTDLKPCTQRDQEHGITFKADGGTSGFSLCASDVGWLFS